MRELEKVGERRGMSEGDGKKSSVVRIFSHTCKPQQ